MGLSLCDYLKQIKQTANQLGYVARDERQNLANELDELIKLCEKAKELEAA